VGSDKVEMKTLFLVLFLMATVSSFNHFTAHAQLLPEVRCGINPANGIAKVHNSVLRHYNNLRLNRAGQNILRKKVDEIQTRRRAFERAFASTNAHSLKYRNPVLFNPKCLEDFFLYFYNKRVLVKIKGDQKGKTTTTYYITELGTGRNLYLFKHIYEK
tara:strand:+ start:267 stop:743 length:477 start_codon:yes stop_codon:yes gene_type:complete